MTETTINRHGAGSAESSLRARMTAALENQAQLEGVAINPVTGVVDVSVGLPGDLAGPELDIRYAWVRWSLENLMAHAYPADGLRLGQVHTV